MNIDPTGELTNITVEPGKYDKKDLRNGKYLEIVSFSDFQVNELTGNYGGEIRLGYLSDGKSLIPVTGGSISGNMSEIADNFVLSNTCTQYFNYYGPDAIKFENSSINGAI
jgi:predicted Zn-dependent protease